jgi:hypothetical protein
MDASQQESNMTSTIHKYNEHVERALKEGNKPLSLKKFISIAWKIAKHSVL